MKWLDGIGRGSSAVDGRGGVGGILGELKEYFSAVISLWSRCWEYLLDKS